MQDVSRFPAPIWTGCKCVGHSESNASYLFGIYMEASTYTKITMTQFILLLIIQGFNSELIIWKTVSKISYHKSSSFIPSNTQSSSFGLTKNLSRDIKFEWTSCSEKKKTNKKLLRDICISIIMSRYKHTARKSDIILLRCSG